MIIGDFFRWLTGTKRCKDTAALKRYIKKGDVHHLAHWTTQTIVYTRDRLPEEEWQPSDVTIQRGEGDCEDSAVVHFEVISSWGGWTPRLIRLENNDATKAHAVCVFERPDGVRGVIDGHVRIYEKKTAWGWVFDDLGWNRSFWVDKKGKRLNIVGWEK